MIFGYIASAILALCVCGMLHLKGGSSVGHLIVLGVFVTLGGIGISLIGKGAFVSYIVAVLAGTLVNVVVTKTS